MTTLIAAKFHQPVSRTKLVQRLQLIQRLNAGLNAGQQVFLVSAPAGFGKTTCINEWVNTLDGWMVSWLTLDTEDDDPGRFFTYIIAALQRVNGKLGQDIESVLRSGQLPPGEIISTILINDILELKEPFLLVLDDFHIIQDPFILEVFKKLMAHLPQPLRLCLITREDPPLPLAKLRANNLLTEIRARDLRFDGHDIELFLNNVIGLSLTQADIAALEVKTEGWIVGLQLAGLSMREQEDTSDFISTLSGSHRYILSYLTEQVLGQQTEEIQRFLLQTSILNKLNGDLCDAVTRHRDSHALLEKLLAANLFILPLDDERLWYRYHHLFADLLRNLRGTLLDEKITELHQRASRWYAQAGMASDAIQHALYADDYAAAVNLLEEHAMELVMQGYAKTVNRWVQVIPEEWQSKSPRTNLAFAWMHLLRGAYTKVSPYLEQLEKIFGTTQVDLRTDEGDPSLVAEWLVIRSLFLYMQGKTEECMQMATRVLEIAPEQDDRVRSLAYYVQASVYQLREDYPKAIKGYKVSIQHGRMSENLVAEIMSTAGLAGMLHEQGQLRQAFEIASESVERIERSGISPPFGAVLYAALGDVHYQWHQVEEARRQFSRALHLSILGGSNTVTVFCHVLLSRLAQLESDLEAAASEIQKAASLVPVGAPEYIQQEVVSQQVRIFLAINRPAAAETALQAYGFSFKDWFSFPDLPSGKSNPHSIGQLYNSGLHTLLTRVQAEKNPTELETGIELANRLILGAFESRLFLVALEALLLRARMYALLGNKPASQADYLHALELAEPEGFIGIFLEHGPPIAKALEDLMKLNLIGTVRTDYVRRILDVFSSSDSHLDISPASVSSAKSRQAGLIDPLTERELDVLRLIARGLKYKEIADNLFISQNTVRFHVKAIYGKLNVNNRTQAIEKARQLQIL